jgi:hypothetical protein
MGYNIEAAQMRRMSMLATSPGLARWTTVLALAAGSLFAGQLPSGAGFTNSLGMAFVRVEPASITLGTATSYGPAAGTNLDYDQQFPHEVHLTAPFFISREPVSDASYGKAGLSGSASDVSWTQAAAFCAWLSQQDHQDYRLPTEAEYLIAGGTNSNSREWVLDWHSILLPGTFTNPAGPANGATKVIRQGAKRDSLSPDATCEPWKLPATGFRVVLSAPENQPTFTPTRFSQSAIKQGSKAAALGPNPQVPYFTARFALLIPPDNDTNLTGSLAGLDPAAQAHNHSPGLEVLPNGDVLAVYFSARTTKGASECESSTRFIQARLRYGAEEWDPPELFCDFKPLNDQSGLLWTEGNTIRFFGGGRDNPTNLPFKLGISTDNGATWSFWLPRLDAPAQDITPQPIVNAFRGSDGAMYFAMDGGKDQSLLWRSMDNGIHWHDMGGRTGGRHSTIVPLDDQGTLLSIGGKSTQINGWSPQNISHDGGATWSQGTASPFPALASNQRPCLIRLANGHLCFVSDSCKRKQTNSPAGWSYGEGCFVAISTNNGADWHFKRLPIELPHEYDLKHGTLGYATLRQAPNGVLHVLATMTHPCLHYEFNEAWVFSKASDRPPETKGGSIQSFEEKYANGQVRIAWSARICPNGRYLLDGPETSYYEDGQKEHSVLYASGCKTGEETFWARDGSRIWTWAHRPDKHTSTWTQFWSNGRKRVESTWNTWPKARDLSRHFNGLTADGPLTQWNADGSIRLTGRFKNGVLTKIGGPKE